MSVTLGEKITTAKQLAETAMYVAQNFKTLYVMGCFGAPMTAANKKRYTQNHDYNKAADRTKMINAASEDTFGFDCVCFIKGLLWGWKADKTKTYGGAGYAINGVPDIGADTMITKCSGVSTDFTKIEIGEAVWCSGHIGVYVGGGLAVECTPAWANKVQITACNCAKSGYNRRNWTKHGKLPYVSYTGVTENVSTASAPSTPAPAAPSTGKSAYTVGATNEETFINFCVEVLGFTLAAACGAAANVKRESDFKTGALGDGGTSYGICQWHNTRNTNLQNWCKANGKDYTVLDGQLWYMKHELETSYKTSVLDYLLSVPNTAQGAYDAGYRWCLKYEIPANTVKTSETRGVLARDTYWPKYKDHTVSPKSPSTSGTPQNTPQSAGNTPSNTQTQPKEVRASKPAYKLDAKIKGTYQTTSDLHIRDGAGTQHKSLTVLPKGTKVQNYGYYSLDGNTKWLYIQVTLNGVRYTGFSSEKYLSKV